VRGAFSQSTGDDPLRSRDPPRRSASEANKEHPPLTGARLEPGNVEEMGRVVIDQEVER